MVWVIPLEGTATLQEVKVVSPSAKAGPHRRVIAAAIRKQERADLFIVTN
jgi:hypothetical protein